MLDLIRKHPGILSFGFITIFFTALGQSFFIAQFIPDIQSDLALNRTEISSIYSFATLLASLNLAYMGRLIDRISLGVFTMVVVIFLFASTLILNFTTGIFFLFIGFYLLRGFGQITLGMIATTTMAKLFGQFRGRATAIISLGKSLGEGVFPAVCVFLISVLGWRLTLVALGIILTLVMILLVIFLIPSFPSDQIYPDKKIVENRRRKTANLPKWGIRELISDKLAFFTMLGNIVLPFTLTGLFFQQASIASFKGWSMSLMGASFIIYGASYIVSNIITGKLVDRYTSVGLQPFVLIPMMGGILALLMIDASWGCFLYMALVGYSVGFFRLVRHNLWAEVYGTKSLGQIKGIDAIFVVVGTSIAPALYALLLDYWVGVEYLLYYLLIFAVLGSILYTIISRQYSKVSQ
jgi:MFS family permease